MTSVFDCSPPMCSSFKELIYFSFPFIAYTFFLDVDLSISAYYIFAFLVAKELKRSFNVQVRSESAFL